MQDLIRTPELAAEATLQPLRRYAVDAGILFSDIVTPLEAIGVGIEIAAGVGPVVAEPITSRRDLERLRPLEPAEDVPHVLETIRILVGDLDVPLIGFAGAPFTLASYLVEGGPSRSHSRTKAMMFSAEQLWLDLLDRLSTITISYLRAQVEAGAEAIQLFDSWAGALAPTDYERLVLPSSRRIFAATEDLGVPRIHFGVGTGEILGLMGEAGADVVGVDWRVPLDVARERVDPRIALQGNLEPAVALGPWEIVAARTRDVLNRSGGRPGYIFNLGHGVLPATPPETLARIVDLVHEEGRVDATT